MNIKDKGAEADVRLSDKNRKKMRGSFIIFLFLFLVMILVIVSKKYFSFVEMRLFEERKSHIVEFTEKASEIVDSVIESFWHQTFASKHILNKEKINSEQKLMDILASTSDFLDKKDVLLFAIDKKGNYYSSDYHTGRWEQTELLMENKKKKQQVIANIPYKENRAYFLFIEPLEKPMKIGKNKKITYLILGVDMEWMQKKLSVNGFGDQCYTYLVNKNGRRIYKHTYKNNFIEGYNVLASFENYKIIHGETYQEFIQCLKKGGNAALEFEFVDSDGKKEAWFVANAPIASEYWQILLFIPTKVLGENTMLLMNTMIQFFAIISILLFTMLTILVVITMISRADKQLMKQKDEANQLLKDAARDADKANKAKSDFLSHMSHDIRTPINGIMGMTEIALKNSGNEEKVLDCLKKISGSSQHLLSLINDVLDMTRIESGKTKVNYENFDLRICLNNCASIIGGQLATRNIELVEEFEEFKHPLLIGDELHLRQIFINILGNSVKFTKDGGKIYFRAKEIEERDKKAFFQFELEDTGIGMKEEFLPHLFEAFAQEDDGMRTTYKGTGLGMAITKKFVDLMGGTIKVESKLNIGTKFLLEFWIDIDYETKIIDMEAEDTIDLSGMKVLLVDDIELNLEIAQSILEEEGVETVLAMNGQEAVNIFSKSSLDTFDAILMDIMMPVLDGLDATRAIRSLDREDAKTIFILAMTANAYEEDIRKTKEAGMNAHLAKPLEIEKMLLILAQIKKCESRERSFHEKKK